MPTTLDKHQEIIGRMMKGLVDSGLEKIGFGDHMALEFLGLNTDQDAPKNSEIADVVSWMISEGLIRSDAGPDQSYWRMGGGFLFPGLQLTSKGLAALDVIRSQEEKLSHQIDKPKGELSPATYTKLGSLIGGILGGFTKSIG
ncbi:hypothetical protein [Roseibium aggregatum]|uniref:DUF2513 domain-containing protein n=1 Tax=Roseibium aggregatum TaxID=187304 RepID=A0A0M6Y086_9HYPH|nr:hypothetical protein [Roseibium aggregatum]CTQ42698.1 hypothetical protein LAL4801_01134 [Roseibium aggregatum]